jgi:hypothetical protein
MRRETTYFPFDIINIKLLVKQKGLTTIAYLQIDANIILY